MTQESRIPLPEADPLAGAEGLGDGLKGRSASSGALMIVSQALQLLVWIGGTAVLARILTPSDFGYLAMVATLIGLVATFREFLLVPIVHRQDLSHEQASGVFWLNGLAGIASAAGVAILAPVLAWFFREPDVLAMTLAMAAGVLINMLSMVHVGMLRRGMRFGAISLIEISAAVAGVVVGVCTALMGAGYWTLVYQQLAVWIWQTGGAWMLCPWRPAMPGASAFRADAGVRSMLRFGQSTIASRVVSYVGRNVDAVLVGHFLGAGSLGLYQKAFQWAMTPFWQIYNPMTAVALASLSRLQDDPQRHRLYARTAMLGLFSLTLPATALLMIEADSVIRLLMGAQWLEAIPLLRILSVGAYFSTFAMVTTWLYMSEGRAGDQLRWSLVSAPIMIVGVAVGLNWGPRGVASGFTIATIMLAGPGVWFCLQRSALDARDFCGSFWRAASASLLAGIGLWLIRSASAADWHSAVQLVVHGGVYLALYAVCWVALPGGVANWRAFVGHFRELRRAARG